MEGKILNALTKSRSAYDVAIDAGIESTLSDKGKLVLKEVDIFYQNDKTTPYVDLDILQDRLVHKYPKHADMFTAIVKNLYEDVSVDNILIEILAMKKRDVKTRLSAAFTAEGNDNVIEDLLEEYEKYCRGDLGGSNEKANLFTGTSAASLCEERKSGATITLSPASLDAACGGSVLRKHHLLFFGRPDVGKSTFAIELCNGFLKQGLKVMYIGNEDAPQDLILRQMTRITGMDVNQIMGDPDKADRLLSQRQWTNFIFVEMTPGSPTEIRAQVDEHRPDVLIVDQSRNLNMNESNRVLQLEKAEQFIRNLGKQYNMLTISFTQAGDSGHNKLCLEMNDVDYSNTGMQASADLMVGIGCNTEYEAQSQRMLSFPKNKMTNGSKEPVRVGVNHRYNLIRG